MTIETTTTTSPLEELDKNFGESTKEDNQTLNEYLQLVIDKYEGKTKHDTGGFRISDYEANKAKQRLLNKYNSEVE